MASKQTRQTRASRIGGAFSVVLHKHTKTRKPEGRLCMERGGRRSREEKGALARMRQLFRSPARHAPDRAEARGCARAVPPLQVAGRSSVARVGQPGQSHASVAARVAPPRPRPCAKSRGRARAQSDHSRALGVLPANRTSLPPPLRPRPWSGRAHGRGCAGILRSRDNGGR